MKKQLRNCLAATALAGLGLPASPVLALESTLAGEWQGAIHLPGVELEVTIRLDLGADGWRGEIDIPLQAARGLELEVFSVHPDALLFAIAGLTGEPTFQGRFDREQDTVGGEFTQGGQRFKFDLRRVVKEPARVEKAAAEDPLSSFDRDLTTVVEAWDVPGLAVAIIDREGLLFARGYGYRDLELELPVTPSTVFAIGSATKAFTGTLVAMLVEEGRLSWREPVRTYLRDFRLWDESATQRLTVEDLLIHRSGLPRHDLAWYGTERSREELFRGLAALEPSADLRQRFQYQNLMYMTAGLLAGRVTGESWESLVQERLLGPLGMTATKVSAAGLDAAEEAAVAHRDTEGEADPEPAARRRVDAVGPAISISSNVEDMARWVRFNLTAGASVAVPFASERTMREVRRPRTVVDGGLVSALFAQPEMPHLLYSLGWFVQVYRGHELVHHGGNIDGFSAHVSFMPNDGVGVVVLANSGSLLPAAVGLMAYDRLLGLEAVDWSGRYHLVETQLELARAQAEHAAESRRKPGTRPSHELDDFVGIFGNPAYGTLGIELVDEALTVTFHGITYPLEHWHYDVFRAAIEGEPGVKLGFSSGSDGRVDRLAANLEPAVDPIEFLRQAPESMRDPQVLTRFVGEYELAGGTVVVDLGADGALTLSVPGQSTYTLEAVDRNEFRLRRLEGHRVRFVEQDGRVTEAFFSQPNGIFPAPRRPD